MEGARRWSVANKGGDNADEVGARWGACKCVILGVRMARHEKRERGAVEEALSCNKCIAAKEDAHWPRATRWHRQHERGGVEDGRTQEAQEVYGGRDDLSGRAGAVRPMAVCGEGRSVHHTCTWRSKMQVRVILSARPFALLFAGSLHRRHTGWCQFGFGRWEDIESRALVMYVPWREEACLNGRHQRQWGR